MGGVLERPAERIYVAAVAATLGGWLTVATVIGLARSPMPALGLAFTVACGIPWWASRRRRSKVRVERKLEAWPDIAHAIGLAGSQVISALVDAWGWGARLHLARGQTIHDVIARIPEIEAAIRVSHEVMAAPDAVTVKPAFSSALTTFAPGTGGMVLGTSPHATTNQATLSVKVISSGGPTSSSRSSSPSRRSASAASCVGP